MHAYDIASERIEVIYDGLGDGPTPLLRVDQLTANRAGEVFVCEDIATDEIDIGLIDRSGRVSKFLSATGPDHAGSELTGVTFDPSGSRMYFSSQRRSAGTACRGRARSTRCPARSGVHGHFTRRQRTRNNPRFAGI